MKEVKKFLLGFLSLLSLTIISAYNGNYYSFDIKALFMNTREYLFFAILFLFIFYAINLTLRKLGSRNGWAIALLASILLTYGLTKLNIDLANIFFSIGMKEDFFYKIAPWIVLGAAAVAVYKWGFGKLLMIFGVILFVLGATGITAESGAAMLIGAILFLIGLKINRNTKLRRELRGLNPKDREQYKKDRRFNRENEIQKWNNAGRTIGRGLGSIFYSKNNSSNYNNPNVLSQYKAGMRRGGLKPTRGRFVSRASVDRYARRYGSGAAKKRFG